MSEPMVSVVIAVYNGELYIREAIDSVWKQHYHPLEIIVVDDGSTDGTARLIEHLPHVRYIRQDNQGQPAALNAGVRIASGDFLAFNDADDLWCEGKLQAQVEALVNDPHLDFVFGHAEQFLEPDAPAEVVAGFSEERRVLPSYLPTAMLIRREAFDRVGDFDETRRIGAVVDWYHRAIAAGLEASMLPQVVVRRRLHASNIGWQNRDTAKAAYLDVVRQALARKRAAAAGGASGEPSQG